MEITGLLHRIDDIENHGVSFQSRYFYIRFIDSAGKMQYIKFKLSGRRVELLEGFEIGDKIKIDFNLEGNEVPKDSGGMIIYDRKEVYQIQGITDIKKEDLKDNSKYHKLEDGKSDVASSFF